MRTRPWPLVVLAVFHFLAPLTNLMINSWLTRVGPTLYLKAMVATGNWFSIFQFFLAFPIAGFAIFRCKRWSIPVFLAATALGVGFDLSSWSRFPQVVPLWLFILTVAIDVLLVTYLLIPAVRAPFLDPNLRWWERQPRYRVRQWAYIRLDEKRERCLIMDVSEGGVFLKTRVKLEPGNALEISFSFLSTRFLLRGIVVHRRGAHHPGYGIRLLHSEESLAKMKHWIAALTGFGIAREGRVSLWEDFVRWLRSLFSREAWFPQVPRK